MASSGLGTGGSGFLVDSDIFEYTLWARKFVILVLKGKYKIGIRFTNEKKNHYSKEPNFGE